VTAVESGRIARAAISALAPIQLLPEDERELAASLMVGNAIIHGGCRIPLDWLGKRDHKRRLANEFTLLCDVIAGTHLQAFHWRLHGRVLCEETIRCFATYSSWLPL
jgi:hypothetical protein